MAGKTALRIAGRARAVTPVVGHQVWGGTGVLGDVLVSVSRESGLKLASQQDPHSSRSVWTSEDDPVGVGISRPGGGRGRGCHRGSRGGPRGDGGGLSCLAAPPPHVSCASC